jgi:hypothetical protein
MPRKSIVWLASYPKSGNTWTRIFLANYLFDRKTPMPINQVHRLGMGDSIEKMYRMAAAPAAGLLAGNFDAADYRRSLSLRGKVLNGIVNNDADINFVKTHNRRTKAFGVELIPPALTRSAIYILRNPLDMVLSYARQYGQTPEFAAAAIGWSEHVQSWTRCRDFPVLALRYEDMQADPEAAFTRVLKHIGVPLVPERVARAVQFSAFSELRKQEDETGFVERSPNAGRFFHSGQAGRWRNDLAPEAIERIRHDHARAMREYGYQDG